jgi:hypothetical protein
MSILIGPNPLCFEGTPYFNEVCDTATPGSTKTIMSFTIPTGTTRKLKSIFVTATNDGDLELISGGSIIWAARLDNVVHNVSFKFDPVKPISAGTLVELKFTADSEPTASCPICAFLSGSDFT